MATDENGRAERLLEQVQRAKAERARSAPPATRGGGLLAQVQRARMSEFSCVFARPEMDKNTMEQDPGKGKPRSHQSENGRMGAV